MCRARRMYFSRKTSGLPNAVSDSRCAASNASVKLVGGFDDPHSASAAAVRRLENHGIAQLAAACWSASDCLEAVARYPGSTGTPA